MIFWSCDFIRFVHLSCFHKLVERHSLTSYRQQELHLPDEQINLNYGQWSSVVAFFGSQKDIVLEVYPEKPKTIPQYEAYTIKIHVRFLYILLRGHIGSQNIPVEAYAAIREREFHINIKSKPYH